MAKKRSGNGYVTLEEVRKPRQLPEMDVETEIGTFRLRGLSVNQMIQLESKKAKTDAQAIRQKVAAMVIQPEGLTESDVNHLFESNVTALQPVIDAVNELIEGPAKNLNGAT